MCLNGGRHKVGRKVKRLTPSGHIKELNPNVPYFLTNTCRIAGLDSILQCQVALTGVCCPAPGMDPQKLKYQHLAPSALKR